MSDEPTKTSQPAPEKEPSKKSSEDENPAQHGSGASEKGSEAGGAPGEGRTGTGLGSTDS